MNLKLLLPFGSFVIIVVFLASGLNNNPGEIPSPFIDKAAPTFSVPDLLHSQNPISEKTMEGDVWIFNVWASWCAACLDEHPLLMQLAQENLVNIVGLNYKDTETEARSWLQKFGNPYTHIAYDESGDVGIDYGVYGVPETFVIDKAGTIKLKHIGPVTRKDLVDHIIPLVKALKQDV